MGKIQETDIIQAAARLQNAEQSGVPCEPVRDLIGTDDLVSAYAVQKRNNDLRLVQGHRIVGHKIGLTSQAVQNQLGVDQPDFGLLWDDKEVENEGVISISELMQPRAEAEIAFVLGADLDLESLTTLDIINAVDYALASIEIVGSRINKWDIKITDTIADNASASHWVIGHRPTKISDFDLIGCSMKMTKNGEIVSEGSGKACLGSPLNAVLWLARKMIEMEQPLQKGDLILSGALGPMVPISAGDQFEATIEGLGSVGVSFSD